jgi:DNA-binding transcriptional MerR regulator
MTNTIDNDDPASMALHSITDVIAMTGISADALRRYEADGLLRPLRTARGVRLYRESDINLARLIYVQRSKRHGLTGRRRATAPGALP